MLVGILVIIAFGGLVLTVVTAAAIKESFNRAILVGIFAVVLFFSAVIAGKEAGKEQERSPNLAGLCKAEQESKLTVSWRVSEYDFEAFKKIVTEDASCDISVVHPKTPAAFSR